MLDCRNDCASESGVMSGTGSADLSVISMSTMRLVESTFFAAGSHKDLYALYFDGDFA